MHHQSPSQGTFTDVINAVADGKGIKQPLQARHAATPKEEEAIANPPSTRSN